MKLRGALALGEWRPDWLLVWLARHAASFASLACACDPDPYRLRCANGFIVDRQHRPALHGRSVLSRAILRLRRFPVPHRHRRSALCRSSQPILPFICLVSSVFFRFFAASEQACVARANVHSSRAVREPAAATTPAYCGPKYLSNQVPLFWQTGDAAFGAIIQVHQPPSGTIACSAHSPARRDSVNESVELFCIAMPCASR